MYNVENLVSKNNARILEEKGNVRIIEYLKDISVRPDTSIINYFAAKMNIRKRQALVELNNSAFTISSGKMQWTLGDVKAATDIKSAGDLLGKALKGSVTKESTVKPKYSGTGLLMLEPTYKYLMLEDVSTWGPSGMVIDDGMFLGCDDGVDQKISARSNLSSALLGSEGLFNLKLVGNGLALLESPVPREELIEISLENDELRIDGNYAVAWAGSLEFTVEKSTKTLLGSAVSGEGLVNVYRGTGKVLMAPFTH